MFIKKGYAAIEKPNEISINIFGYEDETLYHIYTSKQTFYYHNQILKIPIMF